MLCRREQKPNKIQKRSHGGSKNGKNQRTSANTNNREYKHTTIARPGVARQIGNWATREKMNFIRHIETDERREKIVNEYENLFKDNNTIKDLTINIQLKSDSKPIQQKGRPVPIHFQKIVRQELEKLIEKGHLEKADETTENCFISPAVLIIKKDKLVKIALDWRKLNEACVK